MSTELVEPFQAQVGSLYMVLGDLEHQDGKCGPHSLRRLVWGPVFQVLRSWGPAWLLISGGLRGSQTCHTSPLGKHAWEAG